MKKVLNLTPHEIVVLAPDDTKFSYPPSGEVARCVTKDPSPVKRLEEAFGVEVVTASDFQDSVVGGLPSKKDDGETSILVSMPVGQFLQHTPGLWSGPVLGPDSGPSAVRDEKGQIKWVRRLVCYNHEKFS